jgi:hypothetical protein
MDKNNLQDIEFRYFSEPILAEAAGQIVMENKVKIDVIDRLSNYISKMSLGITGSIGEIVSELVLLFAFDAAVQYKRTKARSNTKFMYLSQAITVEEFLITLVGKNNYKNEMSEHIDQALKNGIVSFTHFIKRLDKLTLPDVIKYFIGRCAACQFKDRTTDLDLCIPVVLEDDSITYIFIQVKNQTSTISDSDVIQMRAPAELFKDNQINYKYLSILMSLAEPEVEVINKSKPTLIKVVDCKYGTTGQHTVKHFKLIGLNKTIYPFLDEKVLDALRNLVNCDRKYLENVFYGKYEKKILKSVAMGCLDLDKITPTP